MSGIALRHYHVTLGYCTLEKSRRRETLKRSLRLAISRRRIREQVRRMFIHA